MTFALRRSPGECGIVDNRPLFLVTTLFLWIFSVAYANYIYVYLRNVNNIQSRADAIEFAVFLVHLPFLPFRTISEALELPIAKINMVVTFFVIGIYLSVCFISFQLISTIAILSTAFACIAFTGYRKMHHVLAALPFIIIFLFVQIVLAYEARLSANHVPYAFFIFLIVVETVAVFFFVAYPLLSFFVGSIKNERKRRLFAIIVSRAFIIDENVAFFAFVSTCYSIRLDNFIIKS